MALRLELRQYTNAERTSTQAEVHIASAVSIGARNVRQRAAAMYLYMPVARILQCANFAISYVSPRISINIPKHKHRLRSSRSPGVVYRVPR